jgi:hypothetical protein
MTLQTPGPTPVVRAHLAQLFLLLAPILTGCHLESWSAAGHGGLPFNVAAKECEFQADAATAVIRDIPDRAIASGRLFKKCMIAKGFILTTH